MKKELKGILNDALTGKKILVGPDELGGSKRIAMITSVIWENYDYSVINYELENGERDYLICHPEYELEFYTELNLNKILEGSGI